jgi:hypothetical protein
MNKETINRLMNGLITISVLAIVAGALFKLQHWTYGDRLLIWGFFANFLISGFEIRRLKRIISELEREKKKVD